MPLKLAMSGCIVALLLFVSSFTGASAEMGQGTVRDPVTGKYIDHVYRDWQEGIVQNPATGDYIVTYKGAQGFFAEVTFIPATKIDPTLRSSFKTIDDGLIRYTYEVGSGTESKQNVEQLLTLVSSLKIESFEAPKGWSPHAIPQPASLGSNLILSWTYLGGRRVGGIPPGGRQSGFGVVSVDLPGVASVKLLGDAPVTEWLGHYPTGAVGDQMEEIQKNNHVSRLAAAPRIPVPTPFNAAAVLTSLQKHIQDDLVRMALIDPALVSHLNPLFAMAIDAAQRGNAEGARSAIKDIRHLLKREHQDVDKEHGDDQDDKSKDNRKHKRQIDKLAAKVLDFDLKYIEKRVKGALEQEQRDSLR